MALPKGFRKDIKLTPDHIGTRRREEMVTEDIAKGGTYLPRGIMYEDLDKTFVEFVENDLSVSIDGEKVPVIFLTLQRWGEFARTWKFADEYKNVKLPFILVVRRPDVQVGTNQKSLWNIPGHPTYTYMKVPTWNGGRAGVDVYQIPQPTSVDITYEVRFFCEKMRNTNLFNVKIQETFKSRQYYISPNGHPMPLHLETIGDESAIDDFESRRFYAQLFEMKLLGYILNEENFKVIPSVDRSLMMVELDEVGKIPIVRVKTCNQTSTVNLNVISKQFAQTHFNITSQVSVQYFEINSILNVSNVTFKVDGVSKTLPFNIQSGQDLEVVFDKNPNLLGKFTIKGNLA